MKHSSWSDRLRYRFDNFMSRGPAALIAGLGVLSLAVILVAALLVTLMRIIPGGGEPVSFVEAAWLSLMRTLDAGTMGGDEGWGFRLVMLFVTIGGVFVISTLIGILTTGLESKLEELRKGRSRVIESGHTLILGWNEQIFSIVAELIVANANQRRSCIVILGERDKVEMEDALAEQIGSAGRTRLVCRTGSSIEMADLDIVSIHTARSIIVLSPDDENPDSQVIKTMLAITNNPKRRPEPYHIVAEIRDPRNVDVARMVGRDEVELIAAGEIVSRIIAQTCRQSGLSVVYTELLDFGGDEIYFKQEPGLVGRSFGQALLAYEGSTVIGLRYAGGSVQLNPSPSTPVRPGDQLIIIAEDDDKIQLSGPADLRIDGGAIRSPRPTPPEPERTLILGWNWRGAAIITELDRYVASGSVVHVVADSPGAQAAIDRSRGSLRNQAVTFQPGDTTERRTLDALDIPSYRHVVLLCYSDTLSRQQADARTFMTLLHLRDIADRAPQRFSIVTEMMDLRNRNLAEVTRADDFIVSDRLISLMMSQIAENKALNAVFTDIFDPEGSEIYLKPAADYVQPGRPVSFYTVVESACRRGQVAIGYRLQAQASDPEKTYGVRINPFKSELVAFGEADRIVVLAEE